MRTGAPGEGYAVLARQRLARERGPDLVRNVPGAAQPIRPAGDPKRRIGVAAGGAGNPKRIRHLEPEQPLRLRDPTLHDVGRPGPPHMLRHGLPVLARELAGKHRPLPHAFHIQRLLDMPAFPDLWWTQAATRMRP